MNNDFDQAVGPIERKIPTWAWVAGGGGILLLCCVAVICVGLFISGGAMAEIFEDGYGSPRGGDVQVGEGGVRVWSRRHQALRFESGEAASRSGL